MKKIFYTGITIFLLLAFSGCRDFLDLKGNNTYEVPTSLDHLQALLNENGTMNVAATPAMGDYWSDDYYLPLERFEALPEVFQGSYTWSLKDFIHPNDWSSAYRPIYPANYCLEGLRRIARNADNSAQYDYIRGVALFFRAYYYQQLLWTFSPAYDAATARADVGIVLKEDSDFNTPSVRSSVQEGYDRVIQEAQLALDLLPDLSKIPTLPSKAAAHGLLARAYLSMRQYPDALDHVEEALKLKSNLIDFNKKTTGVDPGQTFTFQKYNSDIVFYSEMNSYRGNLTGGAPVDTSLLRSYGEADLRKHFYFIENNGDTTFRGSYANNVMFSGIATDELHLIRAECLARAGRISETMDALNYFLRFRFDDNEVYVPVTASNKEEALDIVLLERRKTLLFRGMRLMDIKRLNKEGRNIALVRNIGDKQYRLEPNDPRMVVPLPEDLKSFVK